MPLGKNFAFDAIYWQKIDSRFFGPSRCFDTADAWKERLEYLDDEERGDLERLVVQKLEEMKSRGLAWDPDEYTLSLIDIAKKKEISEESQKPHIEVEEVEAEVGRLAIS
jgi:hypothetical protein